MFENTAGAHRHFTVLGSSEEQPFEMQPVIGQSLCRLSSPLVIFLKANIDSDSPREENHRYIHMHFFCSSDIERVS